jgi:phosphoribosylformylglycinamidine synthase
MEVEAPNEAEAKEQVDMACKKLLANMIMENYSFTLAKV